MIETILIPVSGTPTDSSLFEAALAVAQPLGAHMQFYHLRFSIDEGMARTPHFGWQETAEAARSLGAAIPVLKQATAVVLASISSYEMEAAHALQQVWPGRLPSARRTCSCWEAVGADRGAKRSLAA